MIQGAPNLPKMDDDICYICREAPSEIQTPCKHYFHKECLKSWTAKNWKCPYCSAALPLLLKAIADNDLDKFKLCIQLGGPETFSPLPRACIRSKRKEMLECYLTKVPGASFDKAFTNAVQLNCVEMARFLHSLASRTGHPIDMRSAVLVQTAWTCSIETLNFLFTLGLDIKQNFGSSSALLYLIRSGRDIEVIKLLIEKDAMRSPGLCDELVIAVQKRRADLIAYFVEIGGNLNGHDSRGSTCLCKAIEESHFKTIQLLIDLGADANLKTNGGISPLRMLINEIKSFDEKSRLEVLMLLLENGVDLNEETHLNIIVEKAVTGILDDEFLGLLVKYGLDPVRETRKQYRTPGQSLLDQVVLLGRESLVSLFLSNIGQLENKLISKAAFLAIEGKNLGTLKAILRYCPDINLTDEFGRTFLMRAVSSANYFYYRTPRTTNAEFMLFLLKSGSNVNQSDQRGATALHYAAILGDLYAAKLLINNGAIINKRDINGSTALHRAAKYGAAEMVRFLVKKGADINALDNIKRTPENLAVLTGQHEVALIFARLKMTECQYNESDEKLRVAGSEEYISWLPAEPWFI